MGLNLETLAWLVHEEREREIRSAERARLVAPVAGRHAANIVRRAVGRRLIRFGASLAGLPPAELGRPARSTR